MIYYLNFLRGELLMQINKESYEGINYCVKCGEKLEIQHDAEGKLRPKCSHCGWTFYKNPIPAAAVVILNDKKEIVVIKRKTQPNKGGWALPSGYIEINQTPKECAVDEMKEETNLEGKVIKKLGYFADNSPIYEKVISFGFLMKIIGGKLQAGDDAAEACYVAFDDLPEIVFPSHLKFIEQVKKFIDK